MNQKWAGFAKKLSLCYKHELSNPFAPEIEANYQMSKAWGLQRFEFVAKTQFF